MAKPVFILIFLSTLLSLAPKNVFAQELENLFEIPILHVSCSTALTENRMSVIEGAKRKEIVLNFDEMKKVLLQDEIANIQTYTGSGARNINRRRRGFNIDSDVKEENVLYQDKALLSALSKLPFYEGVTIRIESHKDEGAHEIIKNSLHENMLYVPEGTRSYIYA